MYEITNNIYRLGLESISAKRIIIVPVGLMKYVKTIGHIMTFKFLYTTKSTLPPASIRLFSHEQVVAEIQFQLSPHRYM